MPSVLVGVPTLNGSGLLRRCLQSIQSCTDFGRVRRQIGPVKIVVCDDGSREDELLHTRHVVHEENSRLQEACGLELLENGGRRGIASSWNRLVRAAPADVVVLLNDDVEVVEWWLDVLCYSALENWQIGMVALNAYMGLTKGQHRALHLDAPAHAAVPRVDYREARLLCGGGVLLSSSGYAFAFRRDLFDLVGGFDERYFCFYEELDFGVALRMAGYRHAIASWPIVYHMGGATNSDGRNLDAKVEMEKSRKVFREKWGASPGELRSRFEAEEPRTWQPLWEWNTSLACVDE